MQQYCKGGFLFKFIVKVLDYINWIVNFHRTKIYLLMVVMMLHRFGDEDSNDIKISFKRYWNTMVDATYHVRSADGG